jgi:hypothetical protein
MSRALSDDPFRLPDGNSAERATAAAAQVFRIVDGRRAHASGPRFNAGIPFASEQWTGSLLPGRRPANAPP